MMERKQIIKLLTLFLLTSCSCEEYQASTNSTPTRKLLEIVDLLISDKNNEELKSNKYLLFIEGFKLDSGQYHLFVSFDFNDSKNTNNEYWAESKIHGYKALFYGVPNEQFVKVDTSKIWLKTIYPVTNDLYPEFDPLPIEITIDSLGKLRSVFPQKYHKQVSKILSD